MPNSAGPGSSNFPGLPENSSETGSLPRLPVQITLLCSCQTFHIVSNTGRIWGISDALADQPNTPAFLMLGAAGQYLVEAWPKGAGLRLSLSGHQHCVVIALGNGSQAGYNFRPVIAAILAAPNLAGTSCGEDRE